MTDAWLLLYIFYNNNYGLLSLIILNNNIQHEMEIILFIPVKYLCLCNESNNHNWNWKAISSVYSQCWSSISSLQHSICHHTTALSRAGVNQQQIQFSMSGMSQKSYNDYKWPCVLCRWHQCGQQAMVGVWAPRGQVWVHAARGQRGAEQRGGGRGRGHPARQLGPPPPHPATPHAHGIRGKVRPVILIFWLIKINVLFVHWI